LSIVSPRTPTYLNLSPTREAPQTGGANFLSFAALPSWNSAVL
jgi:hypothetical protein